MIPAVHIKEAEPDLLCNERIVYSLLGPHPRIAEIQNTNLYTLPVETRIETARTEPLCIAIAPNGDLQQYLLNHPDIPQRLRAKWGVQIAEGLAFVHSRHIVWADCTPANMLLTADLDILLCDFGGSGIRGSETGVSPPRIYCDPELDSSRNFSGERRIDIYAFGCVFLEILTYNANFLSPTPPDVRRGGLASNGLPLIDAVSFTPFKLIVKNCWDGKYADAQQLYADLSEAWVKFQEVDRDDLGVTRSTVSASNTYMH